MRRQLLRSNPALYVSRTRLSIRNLPIWVSERGLKRLATHAIRAFEEEVKQGERAPLATDELDDDLSDTLPTSTDAKEGKKPTGKRSFWKKTERKTGVRQAKIVRQANRIDPLTGKGRSKGYGFLELERHEDALRVLRWANNNRAGQGLMWAWWREEMGDTVERLERELKANKDLKKEEREEKEARLKKLKARLEEMHHGEETIKDGRTLLLEFSIENISVVKRRTGKEAEAAEERVKSKVSGVVLSCLSNNRFACVRMDRATPRSGLQTTKEMKHLHHLQLRSQSIQLGRLMMSQSKWGAASGGSLERNARRDGNMLLAVKMVIIHTDN